MRTSALLLSSAVAYLISTAAVPAAVLSGQVTKLNGANSSTATNSSATTFVTAPYTAGSTALFTSSIVNVNSATLASLPTLSGNNSGSIPQGGLGVKQGGLGFATFGLAISKGYDPNNSGSTTSTTSSAGFSSANNTSGTSSSGFSSANNTSGTSSSGFSSANNTSGTSSSGFSSANSTAGTSSAGASSTTSTGALSAASGTHPILVLSSLVNSTDPRVGSAGAVFQGIANTQVSTISFQYGTLAAAAGQAGAQSSIPPVVVIDDQLTGTAVTTRYIPVTSGTVSTVNGLTTVSFNATQLRVSGPIQRIGVALYQRGIVAVENITVNGVASSGILAQAQQSFPF